MVNVPPSVGILNNLNLSTSLLRVESNTVALLKSTDAILPTVSIGGVTTCSDIADVLKRPSMSTFSLGVAVPNPIRSSISEIAVEPTPTFIELLL